MLSFSLRFGFVKGWMGGFEGGLGTWAVCWVVDCVCSKVRHFLVWDWGRNKTRVTPCRRNSYEYLLVAMCAEKVENGDNLTLWKIGSL